MRIVLKKYQALFVIFEKAAKFEIVVYCKLWVALYFVKILNFEILFRLFGFVLYVPVNSHVGTVHLTTHFYWTSLTKRLTSSLYTYFRL